MADVKDTTERGYPSSVTPADFATIGRVTNDYVSVDWTETPDLRFPYSAAVYDRMRRSDAQIAALLQSIRNPIIGATPQLLDEGVKPAVADFVRNQLGLDDRSRARRRRSGIVWHEHVQHALLMLVYGFMPFETVYEAGPPPADIPGLPPVVHHLRKLAPRMPRTVRRVVVARDGGLKEIVQQPLPGSVLAADVDGIHIPVEQLVMYVNDREGADWTGQSILRAPYKHWLIKDALLKLGAQIIERNGMGVPIVTHNGGNKAEAQAFAEAFRAGANAGGAIPEGATFALVGVTGSTKDELPLVKYHDEAIARSALAMFLQLGSTDTGSRALGGTFVEQFLRSLQSVMNNIAETTTEHVIRDLVERNFGPDEPYPVLAYDDLADEQAPTADVLVALAGAGLLGDVGQDRELMEDVRRRLGLPELPEEQQVEDDEDGLVDDTTAEDEAVPEDVMAALSEWVEPARSQWEIRLAEVEQPTALLVQSQTDGARNLRAYWTRGKGLAKWKASPHPWSTLERLLRPYIKDVRKRRAVTSSWFKTVFGYWPGERGGKNPIGKG